LPIIGRGFIIKKLLFVFLLPLAFVFASEAVYETNVTFQNFPWGTSQEEFIKKMGQPINREEEDGLVSLVWENVFVFGYKTYMLAYFTKDGLQGGTYYFLTYDMDQLMKCYTEMQQELRDRYGPTSLYRPIQKELRHYECLWNVSGNYVHLKTNTRQGEPVKIFYLSPELARIIFGDKPLTAKK
jgi:hypothetical protein